MRTTTYVVQLPAEIRAEIEGRLRRASVSGADFERAMNSRLCDLEDTIDISGVDEWRSFGTRRCRIYQTSDRRWSFMSWNWAMTHGFDQGAYELVYEFDAGDMTAEAVYVMFNLELPEDYHARSLSMGDVVVFLDEEEDHAMYCDDVGFVELGHDFWEERR